MIARSLICCLALFAVFTFGLRYFHGSAQTGQYQYQQNVIKGQTYLYEKVVPQTVILGTSLANNLLIDSLHGVFNLALPGLHVLDGLNLLLKKKTFPKTIYVETNYISVAESKQFTALFDSKTGNGLKSALPAIREGSQPVGILKFEFNRWVTGRSNPKRPSDTLRNTVPVTPDVFRELLADTRKRYLDIDTAAIDSSLTALQTVLQGITAGGSRIYFLELPVDASLEHLPYADYVRGKMTRLFGGKPGFGFLAFPPIPEIKTVDGIHLNPYSAQRFTELLKQKTDSLENLPG